MSKGILQVGAGIKVFINGTDWGFVTGIDLRLGSSNKAIPGIDSLFPFELAPNLQCVSGSIQVLRIIDDHGLEGRGITASQDFSIDEPYFTLTLVERQTDKVMFQAAFCKVDDQTWHMAAKSLVTGAFTFQGLGWTNDRQNTNI